MTPADHANTIRHALEWMANYNMTGTERTLHIDMQGKAREVLPALDALQAQAEAGADMEDSPSSHWYYRAQYERKLRKRAEAAEARVDMLYRLNQKQIDLVQAAEAERDRLEAKLEADDEAWAAVGAELERLRAALARTEQP